MIARSIGAAPRQRGSSEGWTFSIGQLGEQRLADQLAEGADGERLGLGGADPLERRVVVDVLGLEQLDPSSRATSAAGGGWVLAAAALWAGREA